MMCTKSKPGPQRRSCLTCHQRRKKCDLSKPYCERCLKSGFLCLGYGSGAPPSDYRPHSGVSNPSRLRPIIPAVPARQLSSQAPSSVSAGLFEEFQDLNSVDTHHDHGPGSPALVAGSHEPERSMPEANEPLATVAPSADFNSLWPQEQSRLTTYRPSPAHSSLNTPRLLDLATGIKSVMEIVHVLQGTIPPCLRTTQAIKDDQFARIVYEYRIVRCNLWFMDPPAAIRDCLVARLSISKTMMLAMYLGIQLFQAISQDHCGTAVQRYIGWVDKLENHFAMDSGTNPPMTETADLILAQLELAYLKFTTVDIVSGYIILRKALPRFLRLVAADKSLYMEYLDGSLVVSFTRALSSPKHELERFIIYDTATSFILGVPPLVEYGYNNDSRCVSHGFEWIHGIPFALIEVISQINSWRAGSRAPPLDNWQILERHILAWQPQLTPSDGVESATGCVARLAVQESWRHVVLIYLYIGMCEVSSHDSRVQTSIRQIAQLGETVADLPIGIHMFTHCVMAGMAARLEKHRVLIRERLLSFKGTRVWLFRGPQFSQVLEHLWRGVGAGGAPVTWDDYVRSRCAVIPL